MVDTPWLGEGKNLAVPPALKAYEQAVSLNSNLQDGSAEGRACSRGFRTDAEDPISMTLLRVAFQTLGCKLNQLETESVADKFLDAGQRLCRSTSLPSLCV